MNGVAVDTILGRLEIDVQFLVQNYLTGRKHVTSLVVGNSNHDIDRIDNSRVMKMAHAIILQRAFEGVGLPFIGNRSHGPLYGRFSTLLIEELSIGYITKTHVLGVT
jgi:hypothetical protein